MFYVLSNTYLIVFFNCKKIDYFSSEKQGEKVVTMSNHTILFNNYTAQ